MRRQNRPLGADGVHPSGEDVHDPGCGFVAWESGSGEMPGDPICPRTPHAARVYNYLLGGKDNFAMDRMVAEWLTDEYPLVGESVRENRKFHLRATAWMASRGIRQFLDVGCGLPCDPSTHEMARQSAPAPAVRDDIRVLYADHDPMVVTHANGLLAHPPAIAALRADVREPAAIMASRQARRMLRPDEPVGLLLTAVLHFVEDQDQPAEIVRRFLAEMAPGSCVAISHGTTDNIPAPVAIRGMQAYRHVQQPAVMRGQEQVRALFGDLQMVPPWKGAAGPVVTVDRWLHPESDPRWAQPRRGGEALWAGVAVKR